MEFSTQPHFLKNSFDYFPILIVDYKDQNDVHFLD